MFTFTRIFTDSNGDSQFEEIVASLQDKGEIGFISDTYPVADLAFRTTEETYDYNFHTAPARQFIVLLDGEIEIINSIGEKKVFTGGSVLLVEDITGKGHKTRQLSSGTRKSIFITLK